MRASYMTIVSTAVAIVYIVATMATTVVSQPRDPQQGWYPLPVIDAPVVQELGRWAVAEHNKKANDRIRYHRVVGGEEREDPQLGMKYHFVIDAVDGGGKDGKYEAVMAEQVWLDRRILISFKAKN